MTEVQKTIMLTFDQLISQIERMIATHRLAGNKEELRRIQLAAGVLMSAAEDAGDKDLARRFRLLASQAANRREELDGK